MSYSSYNKQRGSGLMIVLFVIVVMGLMAMVMTKIGTSSQTMTTKEVLGTVHGLLLIPLMKWY